MAQTELINQIVQQVVSALGIGNGPSAPAGAPVAASAPVAVIKAKADAPTEVRKVFITEAALAMRVSAGGATLELASNEYLTPAAVDMVEDKHLTVTRAEPVLIKPVAEPVGESCEAPVPNKPVGAAVLGLMFDKADSKVTSLISAMGYDGLELADYNTGSCSVENLKGLCDAVASGSAGAGIAILPYGADAMVIANKTRGIRAVQGTRVEAVSAGLRHFKANMLILEHAFSMYHEMRAMVRTFAAGQASAAGGGVIAAAIDELERS